MAHVAMQAAQRVCLGRDCVPLDRAWTLVPRVTVDLANTPRWSRCGSSRLIRAPSMPVDMTPTIAGGAATHDSGVVAARVAEVTCQHLLEHFATSSSYPRLREVPHVRLASSTRRRGDETAVGMDCVDREVPVAKSGSG